MGESKEHMDLVRKIKTYVERMPDVEKQFILCDLPEEREKPSSTQEGYRPDVFYENQKLMIIGEAKTSSDFGRKHSIEQYNAYLRKCSRYSGKAVFILAVPWGEHISAKNMLRKMKRINQYMFEISVMNNADSVEKL